MEVAGLVISILALVANVLLWIVGIWSYKQSKRQADNQVGAQQSEAMAQITQEHKSLFLELLKDDKFVELIANGKPIDDCRKEMVGTILINHCNAIYTYASKNLIESDDWLGLQNDITNFFTWNVVKDRWATNRSFYSVEFQTFVDNLTIKGRINTNSARNMSVK